MIYFNKFLKLFNEISENGGYILINYISFIKPKIIYKKKKGDWQKDYITFYLNDLPEDIKKEFKKEEERIYVYDNLRV